MGISGSSINKKLKRGVNLLLHTNIIGEGEPIVFLHTGLQTGMTDFEFQREHFRKGYKIILPDLRGHGQSFSNDIQNFFEDSAKDLLETINHFNIKTIHLVGCSLGALVAVKFSRLYPERINTLSISGVTLVKPDNWLELHEQDMESQANVLNNQEATNYFDQLHASDWRQFINYGKDENWYPFEDLEAIAGFNFPVLYIVGEEKPNETIGATIYPKAHKNVHVAIVPFAGHLVYADQPRIYNNILELFIEREGLLLRE